MSSATQLHGLEARIEALEATFAAGQTQARGTSRAATCVTLILCLTLAAFVMVNYLNLKSSWGSADVSQSVEQAFAEISPAVQTELRELSQKLLPVYSHEARQQLLAFGPQVAVQLRQECDLLGRDVANLANDELGSLRTRVSTRSQQIVMDAYPSLARSDERQQIESEVEAIISNALLDSFVSFQERFVKDVKDVEQCLLKFDISDSGEDTVDLQKKFIHLWLRVLDQELSEI